MRSDPPLIEAKEISKSFGRVQALDRVNFHVDPAEVVALVGDNGAGKSTVIQILCGALRPDRGTIRVRGREVSFRSPRDAMALGIAVVYQDLALVDSRDVAHNVYLGDEPTRGVVVDRRQIDGEAGRILGDLRINVPSIRAKVGLLSGGQRQAVAIARAMRQGGHLVIMDEPTAALGVEEQRKVLRLIEDLSAQGDAVIIVSHNLQHVFSVAHRIVVLRGGRVAGERLKAETTSEEIVRLIVGAGTGEGMRESADDER